MEARFTHFEKKKNTTNKKCPFKYEISFKGKIVIVDICIYVYMKRLSCTNTKIG